MACSRVAGSAFALALAASAFALIGCGDLDPRNERIEGSGVVETRTYDVADFDRIEIGSAMQADVTVAPGGTTLVEVSADDNFFDHISVDVDGGTLEARTSGDVNLDGDRPVLTVTTPTLSSVDLSGATTAIIRAAGTDVTDFEASGASRLRVVDLDGSDIDLEVSGASRATLEGAGAGDAELAVSGASSVDLTGLPLDSARVDVSGASNADLGPTAIVTGSVSGASHLSVDADTTLDVETSGASSARRR